MGIEEWEVSLLKSTSEFYLKWSGEKLYVPNNYLIIIKTSLENNQEIIENLLPKWQNKSVI